MPFKRLIRRIWTVLVAATAADLDGLRERSRAAASLA